MAENRVISEIASPESEHTLQYSDSAGTALVVIDNRPDEAAPAPVMDVAASENCQVDTPKRPSAADIEWEIIHSLLSPADARDVGLLLVFANRFKVFRGSGGIAHVRYRDLIGGRFVEKVAAVRSEQFGCWLIRMFFGIQRRPVVSEALQAVLQVLETRATRTNKRSRDTRRKRC